MSYLAPAVIDQMLDAVFGTNSPEAFALALLTRPFDGTVTEPDAASYARAVVANDREMWPGASGGQTASGLVVNFAAAEEPWGVIVGWALLDDERTVAAGALLRRVVTPGNQPTLPAGMLRIGAS